MAFGNRQWLRVHHTKPSTLGWSVVETNDTTHFQKPWTTNLKITVSMKDLWTEIRVAKMWIII